MLRILGLSESTYYDRKKRAESRAEAEERPAPRQKGRPTPSYSHTFTG
ncbi:hypothetical protein [Paenibacillus sinopodophylli]|nr:hypothetical protein [Paenibacillus sinopodophylli]